MYWGGSETICRVKTVCDGTRAETRFGLPAKWTSPIISVGVVSSVEYWLSCSAGRGRTIVVTLDGLFRVKLKTVGYSLHSPLSPSLLLPCATRFRFHSNCLNSWRYESRLPIFVMILIILFWILKILLLECELPPKKYHLTWLNVHKKNRSFSIYPQTKKGFIDLIA